MSLEKCFYDILTVNHTDNHILLIYDGYASNVFLEHEFHGFFNRGCSPEGDNEGFHHRGYF